MKNYTVIIVAAGNSSRFKQKNNKLLYQINDSNTVIEETLALFLSDPFCTEIIFGVNDEILNFLLKKNYQDQRLQFVLGGLERVDTIHHCLTNHKIKNEMVMIHDGVRCFVSLDFINKLNQTFYKENYEVLIPMLPITETLKKVNHCFVEKTINRDEYFTIQTPQVFKTVLLYNVYDEYFRTKNKKIIYDDSYLVELFAKNTKIHTILGEKQNIKITYFDDLKLLNLGK
ncbi:2-C-methyl-D-erythritol 4-phosphate cytidylyltransferase [Spiroplasma poulsonii]|uniref:2-C-methyl-D-erythritol 4-phosphate cytidylyltransferase n=1 Tax=Spiroplasma poulsonii TaxID=2138 RepID=A0A3S0UC78_9MOLU|nr:IspD/TarI family cytidylyltransferase [Spiroplasma poulsonii]MBW3057772.1 2-C-methyl-D-erythritol 4-phosphate cytidylyltransferase [Spiroplasma poulsonii]RUP78096.1 2-C-methyl-D-erythritol 4-phosphate cytidylyltransferase [Spiroplasma poulsonii]